MKVGEAYLGIKCIEFEGRIFFRTWFGFSETFIQMVCFSAMFQTINNTKLIMAREDVCSIDGIYFYLITVVIFIIHIRRPHFSGHY